MSDSSMEQWSDSELISRCREGNEQAFDVLYRRYRLPLFAYINGLLPNDHGGADDIFQQAWVKVIRNWENYGDQQKFFSWLCRIAHNLVMDSFRRQHPMVSLEDAGADACGSEFTCRLDAENLSAALEEAIGGLGAEQREVLELRRQGVSFQEIAAKQKAKLNTVLGRMHYAVEKLRNALRDYL